MDAAGLLAGSAAGAAGRRAWLARETGRGLGVHHVRGRGGRRGFAAQLHLVGIDDETAHGFDIVGRAGGLHPDRQGFALALGGQHLSQVAHFFLDGSGVLVGNLADMQAQRQIAAGRRWRRGGGGRLGRGRLRRGQLRCSGGSGRSGLGRHLAAAFERQLAQDGANALEHGVIGLFGSAIGIQLAFEHVFGFQESIHHVGAQRHLAAANGVQQVFQQMRGLGQLLKAAEGRRATLDRVRGTEDRIELLDVGRTDIQLQQQLLHLREQLVSLIEEGFVELTEVQT